MTYDIAIIGLGAVGSSALYAASKLGMKVIGIDQFTTPHTFGSSHGESRIIRRVIDDQYTLLASRSYDIWSEIEKQISRKLLYKNGCITLAKKLQADKLFQNKILTAKKYNINYEILDTNNIHNRFPEFSKIDNIVGFYESDAGFANPDLIMQSQLDLARSNGATLSFDTNIIQIEELGQNA